MEQHNQQDKCSWCCQQNPEGDHRREINKTGGGPAPKKPSSSIERAVNMLQDTTVFFPGIQGGIETKSFECFPAVRLPSRPLTAMSESTAEKVSVPSINGIKKRRHVTQEDVFQMQIKVCKEQMGLYAEQRQLVKEQTEKEKKQTQNVALQIQLTSEKFE
ncbi:Hypothetical predicted protein [Mytilus galloprovincialis]|uniref:Uncharacterized protein n=1 Tax=Mytilus galloprovincialis TaxID=29158 RepID=A0A8B6ESC3_MYTGA|nr:Hypothetical predicted protein [Mytilus galloprovincialis]